MSKLRTIFLLSAAICIQAVAAATVSTQISADEIALGTSAQLLISVEGTTNVALPGNLNVDGLQIQRMGEQVHTNFDLGSGRMSASAIYTYVIVPTREGTFEIPAFEITVDGRKEKTEAKKLVVTTGTAPLQPPGTAQGGIGQPQPPPTGEVRARRAFAKLIIPKKEIYVGEVVPVEVQFFFIDDNRYAQGQVSIEAMNDPQVSGEGFTVQKLGQPVEGSEIVDSVRYHVLTFKTTISAVKSGETQAPVASVLVRLGIPSNGIGSLFGRHGIETRNIELKTEPQPIRVKALPLQGRPADFTGAVGDFTIAASAKPDKAAAGDPITLKLVVSGSGNFDTIDDLKLINAEGWRQYPPTSRFDKSDVAGYGGTKSFEIPMVAQQPQTKTPIARLSFFDPAKSKYVTIESQPVAIEAAAAMASTSQSTTPAATVQPTATPAQEEGNVWLSHETKRSWQPMFKRPGFWIANGAAALVLVALVVGTLVRRRNAGPAGQRAAVIRQRDRIVSELGRENLTDEAFCAKALEALALQAGLAGESGPFELVRALESRGKNIGDLRTVLGRADEIKFSGGNLATRLDAGERSRIAAAVREACR